MPIFLKQQQNFSRFQYIQSKKLSLLVPSVYLEPSSVFSSNIYSVSSTTDLEFTKYNVQSLLSPDELTISNDFFDNNFIYDDNPFSFIKDDISTYLNRKPFSTFGITHDYTGQRKRRHSLEFSVYPAGQNTIIFRNQLPKNHLDLVKGKLLDPLEFFFQIHNHVILVNPTISKSSGNEDVDRTISLFLKNSASSISLADGYYRFTISP